MEAIRDHKLMPVREWGSMRERWLREDRKDISEVPAFCRWLVSNTYLAVYQEKEKNHPARDGEISQIARNGKEPDTLEDEGAGLNRYLVSVQRSTEPFTRLLPAPVRKLLNCTALRSP